jgi:hypothetical protein
VLFSNFNNLLHNNRKAQDVQIFTTEIVLGNIFNSRSRGAKALCSWVPWHRAVTGFT